MKKITKYLKEVFIFMPKEKDTYEVIPEGRQFVYKGDKFEIFKKLLPEFPALKKALAFLMDNDFYFFYDPINCAFRAFSESLTKEERNKNILSYLKFQYDFKNLKIPSENSQNIMNQYNAALKGISTKLYGTDFIDSDEAYLEQVSYY